MQIDLESDRGEDECIAAWSPTGRASKQKISCDLSRNVVGVMSYHYNEYEFVAVLDVRSVPRLPLR